MWQICSCDGPKDKLQLESFLYPKMEIFTKIRSGIWTGFLNKHKHKHTHSPYTLCEHSCSWAITGVLQPNAMKNSYSLFLLPSV